MDLTNKEVIERLKAYFMEQEQEDICFMLASLMVDMHRVKHYQFLDEDEKASFMIRMEANDASLMDFLKNGPKGKMKLHKFSLGEEDGK
jgi:hypothetical protein